MTNTTTTTTQMTLQTLAEAALSSPILWKALPYFHNLPDWAFVKQGWQKKQQCLVDPSFYAGTVPRLPRIIITQSNTKCTKITRIYLEGVLVTKIYSLRGDLIKYFIIQHHCVFLPNTVRIPVRNCLAQALSVICVCGSKYEAARWLATSSLTLKLHPHWAAHWI